MIVKILPIDKGALNGKLADVELHFTDGDLAGMRLLGFAIWQQRSGSGRNVTLPARTYSVNGERRSFSLLRTIGDAECQKRLSATILAAYEAFEQQGAVAGG